MGQHPFGSFICDDWSKKEFVQREIPEGTYAYLFAQRMWNCVLFSLVRPQNCDETNKQPSLLVFLFLLLHFSTIHMNKIWIILHIQNIFVDTRGLVYFLPLSPVSWVLCWKGYWKHWHDNSQGAKREACIAAESSIEESSTKCYSNCTYQLISRRT